jgi:hypothetical protein
MKSRGIGGNIIGWYDHFLQTRTVTSSLGESKASIWPGKGCPQGGVLSAIISWNIVFDNFLKLYDNSEITSIGFADDGTLLITGICIHTMYSRMQEVLNRAAAWATEHGLSFCPKKTNAILFTRKKVDRSKLPVLKMYQQEVPNVTETKMLGLQLTASSAGTLTLNRKLRPVKGP